jgi:hypothetical protein
MAHHAHHAHGDEAHPEVGHVVPVRYLYAAGLALLVLTVVTVAVRYVASARRTCPWRSASRSSRRRSSP